MARDYNINVSIGGGDRRGAFGGGNLAKTKTTLNSRQVSEDGDFITKNNLRRVFSIGLALNTIQKGNELAGAYTNNRLRQRKMDRNLTFVKYGIGVAVNPLAGGIYALSDTVYRTGQYHIKLQKKAREASYYRMLSGNNANSGRRYRGDLV